MKSKKINKVKKKKNITKKNIQTGGLINFDISIQDLLVKNTKPVVINRILEGKNSNVSLWNIINSTNYNNTLVASWLFGSTTNGTISDALVKKYDSNSIISTYILLQLIVELLLNNSSTIISSSNPKYKYNSKNPQFLNSYSTISKYYNLKMWNDLPYYNRCLIINNLFFKDTTSLLINSQDNTELSLFAISLLKALFSLDNESNVIDINNIESDLNSKLPVNGNFESVFELLQPYLININNNIKKILNDLKDEFSQNNIKNYEIILNSVILSLRLSLLEILNYLDMTKREVESTESEIGLNRE